MSSVDFEGMIFSKEKMLQRLEKAGLLDEIDEESRDIMSKIDGMPIEKNHFKALVYDELEFYVRDPKYGYIPVNINDCIEKE